MAKENIQSNGIPENNEDDNLKHFIEKKKIQNDALKKIFEKVKSTDKSKNSKN